MRRDTKERTDSSRIEALSRRAVMDTVDYDGDANKVTDESRRELIITSKICGTSDVFLNIEGRSLPAVQDEASVIATSVDTVDASVTCWRVHHLDSLFSLEKANGAAKPLQCGCGRATTGSSEERIMLSPMRALVCSPMYGC